MVGVPAAVMLTLGLWGLDRGGIWRDEAVTFQVARRTVPQIWRLVHGVDAVHGLYYVLMHAVLAVHADEVTLRLPSVAGAVVAAALVAEVGARLAGPRAGLWAGLLYAVNPMVGHYAQEGRSYALVAAGVMGATLLLLRGVERGGWWGYGLVLGVTCWLHEFAVLVVPAHAVTLALARVRGRVWRGWGCAAGAVLVCLLPMVAESRAQAAQVAWLRRPTAETVAGLARQFFGVSEGVYWVCLGLAVTGLLAGAAGVVGRRERGVLAGVAGRRGKVALAGVAAPLAVVPPAVLMLVSQSSPPLYVDRYVLYALAGAPLLVAGGAEWVAGGVARLVAAARSRSRRPVVGGVGYLLPAGRLLSRRLSAGGVGRLLTVARSRSRRPVAGGVGCLVPAARSRSRRPVVGGAVRLVPASWSRSRRPEHRPEPHPAHLSAPAPATLLGVLGLLALALVPLQQFSLLRQDRDPARRPDDLAAIARAAAHGVRKGDAVLYLPAYTRNTELAYPAAFRGTRDLALARAGDVSGTLYGVEVPAARVRQRAAGVQRVWVVADRAVLAGRWTPRNPGERAKLAVLQQEFTVRGEAVRGRTVVRLYVRPVSLAGSRPPSPPRRPVRW
ncbi:glycosyltransferase family 39 protein [Streptomyces sp. AM6-12]|uniref:glycosyltransferase family 39 protein n=1 Tax=Streptomyces sp. AM6-12 TaxID=3345149 RepID=UPI0037A1DC47